MDTRYVRRLPDRWSFAEGAAFPVQAITAWYALHTLARFQPGESVLVHSGAGGVGLNALGLLRPGGGPVVATVGSEAKRGFLRRAHGPLSDAGHRQGPSAVRRPVGRRDRRSWRRRFRHRARRYRGTVFHAGLQTTAPRGAHGGLRRVRHDACRPPGIPPVPAAAVPAPAAPRPDAHDVVEPQRGRIQPDLAVGSHRPARRPLRRRGGCAAGPATGGTDGSFRGGARGAAVDEVGPERRQGRVGRPPESPAWRAGHAARQRQLGRDDRNHRARQARVSPRPVHRQLDRLLLDPGRAAPRQWGAWGPGWRARLDAGSSRAVPAKPQPFDVEAFLRSSGVTTAVRASPSGGCSSRRATRPTASSTSSTAA